jgi:hypothetical protein
MVAAAVFAKVINPPMADQNSASWNQMLNWMRQVDDLASLLRHSGLAQAGQ